MGPVDSTHGRGLGRYRGRRRWRCDLPGTLAALREGESATIATIPDDTARAQALRFGVGEGATVECLNVLPGGPLVLRAGRQEIAVGRGLARRITVRGFGAVTR